MKEIGKKILITGSGSYIGTSLENYLSQGTGRYQIDVIDLKEEAWKEYDFAPYDTVFHVAGIAHSEVGKITKEQEQLYYKVNTELAVQTAEKAKGSGVSQFILMSSMIIYGDSAGIGRQKVISEKTEPCPANIYGDSKWQADRRVRELGDAAFKVVVLRPPMIYGPGSKGNYPMLARIARKFPVFPDVENQRSMLYIDNLCEFLKLMIDQRESGVFFPQNRDYVKTTDMVRKIGQVHGHSIKTLRAFNPMVTLLSRTNCRIGKMLEKAFGNLVYDKQMSVYDKGEYQKIDLEESIRLTENNG